MTREYFLYLLTKELMGLEAEERDDIYRYYLEYFEDRGISAGAAVPPDMDTPEAIAAEILRDRQSEQKKEAEARDGAKADAAEDEACGTSEKKADEGADFVSEEARRAYFSQGGEPNFIFGEAPGQAADESGEEDDDDDDFDDDIHEHCGVIDGDFDRINVDLSLGGFRIEMAQIEKPELLKPLDKWGEELDYQLRSKIKKGRLKIRDKYRSDIRITRNAKSYFKPATLRLPYGFFLKHAKLDLAMGGLEIRGLNCEFMKAECALGSLRIQDSHLGYLDAELAMGSLDIIRSEIDGSKMDVMMGSIKGNGVLKGKHKIASNMGSVKLNLDQSKRQTEVRADVSMGSFKIDGSKVNSKIYGRDIPAKPEAELYIQVSCGSINLNFNG